MKIQAVLFDLDGTLIDTAADLCEALNTVLVKNGYPEKQLEQIKPLVSSGVKGMLLAILPDEDAQNLEYYCQQILDYYLQHIDKHSTYFAGVQTTINALKQQNINWGIITNKPQKFTHPLLKKMNIVADVVVCGDTCTKSKPHPEPLLYACEQLNIPPGKCLFVGDDNKDMQAGKNAGIKTVAVSYGYGVVAKSWGYNELINHPLELLQFLED